MPTVGDEISKNIQINAVPTKQKQNDETTDRYFSKILQR
jgi:hypothetical protein